MERKHPAPRLGPAEGASIAPEQLFAALYHELHAAANLAQVVEFYNLRFQMNLTAQEKSDLVAFLRAL